MVLLMVVPWPRVTAPGLETVKLGALMDKGNVVVEVCFPDVPVTVTSVVPRVAELLETSDKEVFPFAGFGEMYAVTPFGKPETERLTNPLKPYSWVIEIGTLVAAPCPIATLPGLETTKVGAKMPRGKDAVAESLPDVPVIVTLLSPIGAVLVAESVSSVCPLAGFGEMDAVTPTGRPDTASFA